MLEFLHNKEPITYEFDDAAITDHQLIAGVQNLVIFIKSELEEDSLHIFCTNEDE